MKEKTCFKCGKLFANKYSLERHLKTVRCYNAEDEIIAQCQICNKWFINRFIMENHRSSQHPVCDYCEKMFGHKRNLEVHLKKKTCQKPFAKGDVTCPVCGRLYTRMNHMMSHLRTKHPEEAPEKRPHRLSDILEYKCCNQAFVNGRALDRHRKTRHFLRPGYLNEPPKTDEDETCSLQPIKKVVQTYKCLTCGKDHVSPLRLVRHEMEDHNVPYEKCSLYGIIHIQQK